MTNLFKKLFFEERWFVCFHNLSPEESIFIAPNEVRPFCLVHANKNCWIADPFLIEDGSGLYLFCEETHTKQGKAIISYSRFSNGQFSNFKPAIESSCHLSYPQVFKLGQSVFMIPESSANRTVDLLQCVSFPDKWIKSATLFSDFFSADNTLFFSEKKPFLFLYETKEEKIRNLWLAKIDFSKNPIVQTSFLARTYFSQEGRPGGNVFEFNGEMIRVSQPGISRYGERIVFSEFSFSENEDFFQEREVGQIKPSQIRLTNSRISPKGVHTFNVCHGIEVIDINGTVFNFWRPLQVLLRRLRLFGFDQADKRHLRVFGDKASQI